MSGNWLRTGTIGLFLALTPSAALMAQSENSATLDTVMVTASRAEEKLREVTGSVSVITEEMIKKSAASDLKQLLRQQGIEVDSGSTGFGSQQPIIRGIRVTSSPGYGDMAAGTIMLLNGRRIGGPSPEFLGLSNIERIEIVRGPSAVQYGASGLGGVINIITRRGDEKTRIRAEAGAGSYDLERFKLAASGQSETGLIDFSFGAGQQYSGDHKTGDGWVWEGSRNGRQLGFNADLGVNFMEGQRLGFNYYYAGVFGSETPNMASIPSHFNPGKPDFTGMTSGEATVSNLAVTYEGASEDRAWNWMGRVNAGKYLYETTPWTKAGGWGAPSATNTDMKNLTATLGYDPGGIFALSGGLDYLLYDIETGGTEPKYENFGAFLSGKLRFFDDSLIFSAGGRFDSFHIEQGGGLGADQTRNETNFSPSVGVAYLPLDWLKLRANYSQGFRMPVPTQMFYRQSGAYTYLENMDLKPEKSKTWEVGLDVNYDFFSGSLTYFHSKYVDKIQSTTVAPTIYRNENLKGATMAGYELALSADLGQAFNKDFTLRPYFNMTYMPTLRNDDYSGNGWSVQDTLGDDTFPFVSEMTMSYGLDFFEPNIDLMVNVNATYFGKKLMAVWAPVTFARTLLYHTPGTVASVTLEKGLWEFENMGKLKVRAEVNNVFDKYLEQYIEYPGPGRNFYLGLIYEY